MANFNFSSKVVSYEVVAVQKPEPELPRRAPLKEREEVLKGRTYKVSIPSRASLYVTINDDEDSPFEIFINSKDTDHQQWVTALTRVMSAVFRREDDVAFLAKELKGVVDPNGGFFKDGKYRPSIVHEIGRALENHLTRKAQKADIVLAKPVPSDTINQLLGTECPSCGEYAIQKIEGCEQCVMCSYSKCG